MARGPKGNSRLSLLQKITIFMLLSTLFFGALGVCWGKLVESDPCSIKEASLVCAASSSCLNRLLFSSSLADTICYSPTTNRWTQIRDTICKKKLWLSRNQRVYREPTYFNLCFNKNWHFTTTHTLVLPTHGPRIKLQRPLLLQPGYRKTSCMRSI